MVLVRRELRTHGMQRHFHRVRVLPALVRVEGQGAIDQPGQGIGQVGAKALHGWRGEGRGGDHRLLRVGRFVHGVACQ